MLALQKGLLNQTDVTGILREFDFFETVNGDLEVKNPPTFEINTEDNDA